MSSWNLNFLKHGVFHDLESQVNLTRWREFPTCEELNQALAPAGFSFVSQSSDLDWQGMYYEKMIHDRQQIPTRPNNWHDLFNACIWTLFPKTKEELCRLHVEDIAVNGQQQRSKRRNALTLFDECGVIVPTSRQSLKEDLQNHQWLEVFWEQRRVWGKDIQAFVFGHGMYELAMTPFEGLTGKAFFVDVTPDFFELKRIDQVKWLDDSVVDLLRQGNRLLNNQDLSPLPLLGVPGWYEKNEEKDYYLNQDYFRPKRKKSL